MNFREDWRGHLWQGRFASFAMDEAHLAGEDDSLVEVGPLPGMVADWGQFLASWSEEDESALRRHERTGRPAGDEGFVVELERLTGRVPQPQKRGPKAGTAADWVWCPLNSSFWTTG